MRSAAPPTGEEYGNDRIESADRRVLRRFVGVGLVTLLAAVLGASTLGRPTAPAPTTADSQEVDRSRQHA